jgi:LPS export ABC transporter protein LptC
MKNIILFFLIIFLASCSFVYPDQEGLDSNQPDIVMENVEYTRVRSGDPIARFMAEQAMRFEERKIMELKSFSFEQFEKKGMEINAYGMAGSAEFMIDSGDVRMNDGVKVEVDSEDITIETKQLEWRDKEHTLYGGNSDPVTIFRANGTKFTGIGFFADARLRTWMFSGEVSGSYIHDDDEDEEDEPAGDDTEM